MPRSAWQPQACSPAGGNASIGKTAQGTGQGQKPWPRNTECHNVQRGGKEFLKQKWKIRVTKKGWV